MTVSTMFVVVVVAELFWLGSHGLAHHSCLGSMPRHHNATTSRQYTQCAG